MQAQRCSSMATHALVMARPSVMWWEARSTCVAQPATCTRTTSTTTSPKTPLRRCCMTAQRSPPLAAPTTPSLAWPRASRRPSQAHMSTRIRWRERETQQFTCRSTCRSLLVVMRSQQSACCCMRCCEGLLDRCILVLCSSKHGSSGCLHNGMGMDGVQWYLERPQRGCSVACL